MPATRTATTRVSSSTATWEPGGHWHGWAKPPSWHLLALGSLSPSRAGLVSPGAEGPVLFSVTLEFPVPGSHDLPRLYCSLPLDNFDSSSSQSGGPCSWRVSTLASGTPWATFGHFDVAPSSGRSHLVLSAQALPQHQGGGPLQDCEHNTNSMHPPQARRPCTSPLRGGTWHW